MTTHTLASKLLRSSRSLAMALAVAGVAGSAHAGSPATGETPSELGQALDAARSLPAAERALALEDLDRRVASVLGGDLSQDRKAAMWFLSGELNHALARYDLAVKAFRNAEKESKKGALADDASIAMIQSMEAAGRDAEASKEWAKWLRDNAASPSAADAKISRAWNAIRSDSLRLASSVLKDLRTRHAWTARDPRVVLATNTIAFLEGRYADVSSQPVGSPLDGAITYLGAMTDEAAGRPLQAAARYQDVITRYADPALHDVALLARANVFLKSGAHQSAAEEFARIQDQIESPAIRGEARLRRAAALVLAKDFETGASELRAVTAEYDGQGVAARAQMILGEVMFQTGQHEEAISEFNQVLRRYFQHGLASLAQYRVGRCLDALGRSAEATAAYQAVVSGYPTAREAPAAAYLAGAGILAQNRPRAAVPYFRLVLDRYAPARGNGTLEFETAEKQELVEAALCLLELSYHRSGDLGLLSGTPHLMLQRMPASRSPWRAYALLIDADALAAQGRHADAEAVLATLLEQFDTREVTVPAYRLLAWTYAQQGDLARAMETQDRMLARFGSSGLADVSVAYLNKGHILFNEKKYKEAAKAYETFIAANPEHADRASALFQAGMCYQRLNQSGDAVDRWETAAKIDPTSPIAEKALARAGDVYFTTNHYDDARRCYQALIAGFADSRSAAVGALRIAQCDYNAGRYPDAVAAYSSVIDTYPTHAVAAEARRGIEQSLYQLGQGKDGEAVLADLVEKYPSSSFAADAQFEIALRRYQAKEYEAAADAFRRVVSQFPSYSAADRAHFLMADSYARLGRTDDVRTACEQFVTFFPNSEYRASVLLQLGAARFAAGDYMRAAADFTSVLADTVDAETASAARFNLALCHRMLGDTEQASAMLTEYRKSHPGDARSADVAYQLGTLADDAGKLEDAVKEYGRALAASPNAALAIELNYRIGSCRERLNDETGALAAYAKATAGRERANPYRLSALAHAAALHEKRGEFKRALAVYRDLAQNATDPDIVAAARERASQLETARQ